MSEIIVADKLTGERLHGMPDELVGARVAGWMYAETPGRWWIAAYTSDGNLKTACYREGYLPSAFKQAFALRVLRYVNQECNFGGVWLSGFLDKDIEEEFYLLWKDSQGNIQVPIEFPFPVTDLIGWKLDSFCKQATEAHEVWRDWHAHMEYSRSQKEANAERGAKLIKGQIL